MEGLLGSKLAVVDEKGNFGLNPLFS